ncbi:UDP-4-amino-4,6-dideoxy-N-acetyl-beta-L-altrosamine N-acetyltransferase [Ureibacillus chungkukjangi]|uniref:UDP-4-amino-4, 6-dideoxy-N-acetyl-beta-L-altrosamine N-acetyltransferase n=1 Tax=Ureibacillus chungkukjangi TaxID=1202712 RepID=UPI00203B0DAC|nr:UDP-4-amino-4,6-dideoxy-N-acetyl-beta-L-altrosamine N-acetyltransferase [Ureibacillus chungkukjangi]MCM3389794.1 UDP-4-amino-4,6-dideoxy-N-acetyl-beta-L-altrosamine N-acetyltransferase [Ureibacillus chungkukjangi]
MIAFKKLEVTDLELVLEWRTSEHVTQYMYTDIEKSLENQYKWFERISTDDTQYYWMIYYKEQPIGLISLNQIDRLHQKSSFGYYIGDLDYSIIAGRIHPYLYNFAFFELGINKLYAEVMEGNEGMMKMHRHYGFSHVATFQEHVYKNNQYYNVEYFELLSSAWKNKCRKFHKYQAEFPI